jgi:predicted outer membrane repeat protein
MMRSSYTNSNNCIFVNNSAGKNGGALYLYSGPQSFYMTLT